MTDIVGKLWGFCHTLRHDGIEYGDYIEQLTYLLFRTLSPHQIQKRLKTEIAQKSTGIR